MTEARELLKRCLDHGLHNWYIPGAWDKGESESEHTKDCLGCAIDAYLAQPMTTLFQRGIFELHSGKPSNWKIDCDALTDSDIATLAEMIAERKFGSVEGVPTGGLRLAQALEVHASEGPLLIVDDVLTTGTSMEKQRAGREAIGAVIFARGVWPSWVTPLFAMGSFREGELVAALEGQGGEGSGTWHLWTCPKKPCLKECREARAALQGEKE